MLTPQDIQEKAFGKAVFGGYDMAEVDDFLEELGNDYQSLYKENAVLKGKLKVLVDKVEEYRSTEDAMRMALLTAQKMSDDMLTETQQKCAAMTAEAEAKAEATVGGIADRADKEERRLASAKAETAKFVALSRQLIANQAEFLRRVTDITGEAEAEEPEEPVFSPEAGVGRQDTVRAAEKAPEKAPEKTAEEIKVERDTFLDDIMQIAREDAEETRRIPDLPAEDAQPDWSEEDEATTPRPRFKFDDLRFGSNYSDGK